MKMPFDGRGRYDRPHCDVHGKGHRYAEQLVGLNARTIDNQVRQVRARRCKCGTIRVDMDAVVSRENYERWNDIPFDELPEQIVFPDTKEAR